MSATGLDASSITPTPVDPCAYSAPGSYSYGYHGGALATILVASLLGTLIPIVAQHFPATAAHPFVWICGKHIGTGVLLALSLIHLLGPAFGELTNPCNPPAFATGYNYAPLFAMLAAIAMHFIETTALDYTRGIAERQQQEVCNQEQHAGFLTGNCKVNSNAANAAVDGDVDGGKTYVKTADGDEAMPAVEKGHYIAVDKSGLTEGIPIGIGNDAMAATGAGGACKEYVHGHDSHGHTHGVIFNAGTDTGSALTISAYILEFGLTAHSVIIGITTAVADDTMLNTLLPALTFHQFFGKHI